MRTAPPGALSALYASGGIDLSQTSSGTLTPLHAATHFAAVSRANSACGGSFCGASHSFSTDTSSHQMRSSSPCPPGAPNIGCMLTWSSGTSGVVNMHDIFTQPFSASGGTFAPIALPPSSQLPSLSFMRTLKPPRFASAPRALRVLTHALAR